MLPVPVTTVQLGASLAGNESSLATSTQSSSGADSRPFSRKAVSADRIASSTGSKTGWSFELFTAALQSKLSLSSER